jgi:PPOX class probable F420-dependent enzyme
MTFDEIRPFLEANHRTVVTTLQPNGAVQTSVVVGGALNGKAVFVSVMGKSAKVRNLRRNPRCTVLGVDDNWRSWVSVQGEATLFDYSNTDAEEMRVLLRDAYRACGGDHPDWDEYDSAMRKQDAVVVLVTPEHLYGQLR